MSSICTFITWYNTWLQIHEDFILGIGILKKRLKALYYEDESRKKEVYLVRCLPLSGWKGEGATPVWWQYAPCSARQRDPYSAVEVPSLPSVLTNSLQHRKARMRLHQRFPDTSQTNYEHLTYQTMGYKNQRSPQILFNKIQYLSSRKLNWMKRDEIFEPQMLAFVIWEQIITKRARATSNQPRMKRMDQ